MDLPGDEVEPDSPGSQRHLISDPLQLTAAEMRLLLEDLNVRLKERGISASVYIVGGAALALTSERQQMTPDIDALLPVEVLAISEQMAQDYGLPASWINSNAAPYIPPRPAEAMAAPTSLGLTVHVAPLRHLLAMKIVAMRAKDRPDIERLLADLGMDNPTPPEIRDLLYDVYQGEDRLADVLGVRGSDPDKTDEEAIGLGVMVARLAKSAREHP